MTIRFSESSKRHKTSEKDKNKCLSLRRLKQLETKTMMREHTQNNQNISAKLTRLTFSVI